MQTSYQSKYKSNREYDDFQNLLSIETRLCRVKNPWAKAAVEYLVEYVKNNFNHGRTSTSKIRLFWFLLHYLTINLEKALFI